MKLGHDLNFRTIAQHGICDYRFYVSRFFKPNLNASGRRARGVIGAIVLIAGIIVAGDYLLWLGLILVIAGLFAIFEAVSGWCVLRACGIRTKV